MSKSRQYAIEHDSKSVACGEHKLSQVEKFRTLARELGADESEALFDEQLKRIENASVSDKKQKR